MPQQSKRFSVFAVAHFRPVMWCVLVGAAVAGLLSGCGHPVIQKPQSTLGIPRPQREFRAAWVATVDNIDWPSRPGLSADQQKQEAIAILDTLKAGHFNAVIFQVRPQCDAMYPSAYEPWSYFLSGVQAQPPAPFYDPLDFWIRQAHDRGLELHAWFNPYRAQVPDAGLSAESIVNKRPDLVRRLANGTCWLDPSLTQTQDYSWNVVMDVVRRYDVDGIHFDDYFYPYPEYNDGKDFPDEDSWQAYQRSGGRLSRGDWRRDAVNRFVQRVYTGIRNEKPKVKFGISPFGIWRPGYPASIKGMDQYSVLYADAKLWLNEGWVDYFSPQLYWPIDKTAQSFPVLLGWWSEQNARQRHLWPGIKTAHGTQECINQIMITRGMLTRSAGAVHWHAGVMTKNNGQMADALRAGPYAVDALPPTSPWLDNTAPASPQVELGPNNSIRFRHSDSGDVFRWVVYVSDGRVWRQYILNRNARSFAIPVSRPVHVGVSAVDRTGNESDIAFGGD